MFLRFQRSHHSLVIPTVAIKTIQSELKVTCRICSMPEIKITHSARDSSDRPGMRKINKPDMNFRHDEDRVISSDGPVKRRSDF